MTHTFRERAAQSIRQVLPKTLKTCIWIVEITVGVSLLILFLRYFQVLPWISSILGSAFGLVGLPGEAALAYVSGYFVNVYSAVAVAVTLGLDTREMTILAVMVLCSHNMIVETAVQKKTGTSSWLMVSIRTSSAIILGVILNLIMPQVDSAGVVAAIPTENPPFLVMLQDWALSTTKLVLTMTVVIFFLNIIQRLLSEFGVIRYISKFLRPLLTLFGLPARCSFLWIIANVIGLAYGAAAMIDEVDAGKLTHRDIQLVNTHICISHSNFEDLILVSAIGGVWWIILLARWLMSMFWVWCYRLFLIPNKFVPLRAK